MSSGLVLAFMRRPSNPADWSQQELAEFYRVESALLQGGLSVSTDRGVSDEGDPWFVFCRADNEDVIAHFARIDREYVVVSNLSAEPARSTDFRRLIRQVIDSHPMMLPMKRSQGQKILLHPAALLTALLASAYFLSSEKDLANGNVSAADSNARGSSITSLLTEKFAVMAAVGLAAIWIEHQAESLFKFLENKPVLQQTAVADGKATHLAAAGDAAPGEDAIVQAIGADGSHKLDTANVNLPTPQDADNHGKAPPVQVASNNPAPANAPNDNGGNVANSANVSASDHVASARPEAAGNDTDSVPQPTPVVAFNALAPSQSNAPDSGSAENGHSSSATDSITPSYTGGTNSDAFHVAAAEIDTSLVQPIVLSNNAVTLNSALHQAFLQVGFDTTNSAADSGNSSGSSASTTDSGSSGDVTSVSFSILSSTTALFKFAESVTAAPLSEIEQTLEAFLQNTKSYEVDRSGAHIIIIDTNLADAKSAGFGVETWDMGDGSTLSIVGIIPHHHSVAA